MAHLKYFEVKQKKPSLLVFQGLTKMQGTHVFEMIIGIMKQGNKDLVK